MFLKKWTVEEMKILKQLYAKADMTIILDKIPRSEAAIRKRASQLRLSRKVGNLNARSKYNIMKTDFENIDYKADKINSMLENLYQKLDNINLLSPELGAIINQIDTLEVKLLAVR